MDKPIQSQTLNPLNEWLIGNSLGGYASSTLSGENTRKYHGLLVANLPGFGRAVLLAMLEEILIYQEKTYYLSAIRYHKHFQPNDLSLQNIKSSTNSVQFDYHLQSRPFLRKILWFTPGKNTVQIDYHFLADGSADLTIRPLFAMRNFHKLTQTQTIDLKKIKGKTLKIDAEILGGTQSLRSFMTLDAEKAQWHSQRLNYAALYYREEAARGYPACENLSALGHYHIRLRNGQGHQFSLLYTLEQNAEIAPARQYIQSAFGKAPLNVLEEAKKKCLVKKAKSLDVIAGYHWFDCWGRDSFIALPSLCLKTTKDFRQLEAIVDHYIEAQKDGLIPNYLSPSGHHPYNSIDASLWLCWALSRYFDTTPNKTEFIKKYLPALETMYSRYAEGVQRQEITFHCRKNGLIYAGNPSMNLTWMDAQINGKPVTPRYGYIVEINALWYHLTVFLARLYRHSHNKLRLTEKLEKKATQIKQNFRKIFVHEHGLYDFVTDEDKNTQLRPNQMIATGLENDLLNIAEVENCLRVTDQHLITPYGLRTLAPSEHDYCPCYQGDQQQRDQSYHNGTIWPWLWIFYLSSLRKLPHMTDRHRAYIRHSQEKIVQHIYQAGIGGISEIFDAEAPFTPKGAILQAWSVAACIDLFEFNSNKAH